MKITASSFRVKRKGSYHRYYKCHRCGYISEEKSVCPVCRQEGRRVRLKKA